MKPITTISELTDHSWHIILVAAIGFYFEGTVTRDWLEREVSETTELKGLEDDYEDEQ